MIPRIASTDLRLLIETFEQAISTLCDRSMDADTRSAVTAVRASWTQLADSAFGATERARECGSCRRSNVQAGPRCVYCWNRLVTLAGHVGQ